MSAKLLIFGRPFLFVVLVHFAAFSPPIHTLAAWNTTADDCVALLAIKSMIKDDPKGVMTSWNHCTTNFCKWRGVTCSARHKRVTHLDLSAGGLVGTLSHFIGNLSFLRGVWLYDNSFSGEIPSEIGRLFRLRDLRLYNNSFMGSIPAAITNCSNLQVLHLGYNNLVGKIPDGIGSLFKLEFFIVHVNILEGGFPLFIANLTLLETLSLANCELGGSFPNVFQRLTNLRRLAVTGNKLTECWEKWPSLVFLDLDRNNLSGEIPRTLGSIPTLQFLYLVGNKMSGRLPSSLMNLSRLKIMQLGRNNLVGTIPPWIGIKLTSLKILDLTSNNFYGNIPHQLCYLSRIQILELAHNNMSGYIPRCFSNFSVLSGIETNLELQFTFSNDIVTVIAGDILLIKGREDTYKSFLGIVTLLDLSSNNISGKIPSELTALRELKSLTLSRNQLTGKNPR